MHDDKPRQASAHDPAGARIRLGTRIKTAEPVYWMIEDSQQPAATLAILGSEATGSNQLVHSVAIQLLRQKAQAGEPIDLLLFEGLDDYGDSRTNFPELTGARVLRLHKLPFNPLRLSGLMPKPQLHAHIAMIFADSLARAYGLSALEKSTLVQSIISAYASRGITSDPLTWSLPAPGLEDVYEEYCARPQGQHSDTLAQILDNLSAMELFDSDQSQGEPLFHRLRGTVMIDMSGYSEALKHFALDIILEVFREQMHIRGRTLNPGLRNMILIDNADRLLASGSPALEALLTQGQEFGIGLLLAVQSMDSLRSRSFDCRRLIHGWVLRNVESLRKADLEFLLQTDIHDSELERLYLEARHLGRLRSLICLSGREPVLAADLPFYEIAADTAQSYLIPERAAPKPEPLEGMPLLDFDDLAVLGTLDDEISGPMGLFDGL